MNQQEYADLLKSAALSLGKKLVMEALISKLPFLGLAWVNPIVALIVGKILEIAIKQTELGLFFSYIDMRTSAQGRAFQDAAIHNREIRNAGTEQEIAAAEIALINSFRAFAKFNS
jgi:hypothetical protein